MTVLAVLPLASCVQPPNLAIERGAGVSDEVLAFQQVDARLHYRDAGIVRNRQGCSFYQGIADDGQKGRVPLTLPSGAPICHR